MERSQNIRQASLRQVVADTDFGGNPIISNEAGGVYTAKALVCAKCGSLLDAPFLMDDHC